MSESSSTEGYKDADTLRQLYHEQGMSIGDIGDRFGVGKGSIQYWMRKFDIETRTAPQDKDGWTDVRCDNCGDVFPKRKWMVERSENDFCNKECKAEFGRATATCDHCGDEFPAHRYYVENEYRDFCSDDCYRDAVRERMTGDTNPTAVEKVDYECASCGATVPRYESQTGDRVFCDRSCHRQWQLDTDTNQGENHHNYAGGYGTYSYTWERIRLEALEIVGHECQICGMTNQAHLDETGFGLHGHHIKKALSFDDPEDSHTLDNILILCQDCHVEYEGEDQIPAEPPS